MGTPFIAEVKIISWNFPPKGWAFCNGQTLPINQNQALFAVIGAAYGGDGQATFALPNLQGRTPIGTGAGQGLPSYNPGQSGGEAAHTLTIGEMAAHPHVAMGSSAEATTPVPNGGMLAVPPSAAYLQGSPNTTLNQGAVGNNAGGQPHNNLQPYQVLNFVIALVGIFPSRS